MALPWIIGGAVAGLLAGPVIRAVVFAASTSDGQWRRDCPYCSAPIVPGRPRWRPGLPVTGRCPACRARVGPYTLAPELAAAGALVTVAARTPPGWELAALAWLAVVAVPLTFTDIAARRLPDRLTAAAFAGTLALLAVAAFTGHEPGRLARAAAGAAALACFYVLLCLIRPGEMGLGDAKAAGGIGLALGWVGWQALLTGTFAGFALAALYGGAQMALRKATRASQFPLGPFLYAGALVALVLS